MSAPPHPDPASAQSPANDVDENQIIAERRAKLARLRSAGVAFPNDFKPADRAAALVETHDGATREALQQSAIAVSVAGRMGL